jgi:Fuc2NAc and GlcNAc transferase
MPAYIMMCCHMANWDMHSYWMAGAVTFAFFASMLLTGVVRQVAIRQKLMDVPNSRSSHAVARPRGGGIAIVVVFLLVFLLATAVGQIDVRVFLSLAVGGGAIAIVGFIDDRMTLSATVRFSVHLIAALIVVAAEFGGSFSGIQGLKLWMLCGTCVLAVLALVWSTNLFNFMDGIDGIAGVQAVFFAGAGALLCVSSHDSFGFALSLACLAAASAGFLCWNWPPAQIFMGDVGSGFLGFTLAALALDLSHRSAIPYAVWPILGGIFLVDATVTLLRRMLRGERWFEAHRSHAYQHLARRMGKHLPVTLSTVAVDLFWLLPWSWYAVMHRQLAWWCLLAATLPLLILAFLLRAGQRE